jgi:hypothetical protein
MAMGESRDTIGAATRLMDASRERLIAFFRVSATPAKMDLLNVARSFSATRSALRK